MLKASDVVYRKAVESDLEQIIKLSLQVPKLNKLDKFIETDVEKGSLFLARLIEEDAKEGCALVATINDVIVGLLILIEGDIWWSKQRFFTNVVFYVHPKYRKLGIQKSLLDFAKMMADDSNLPFVLDFYSLAKNSAIIESYMNMQGMKSLGFKAFYVKE